MLIDITEPGNITEHQERVPAIGIDLGTTHSLVGVVEDDSVAFFQDMGSSLVPSVVAYEDGKILVGQAALAAKKPIHSIKRLMGKSYEDMQHMPHNFPYPLVKKEQSVALDVEGVVRTPVEISAEIIRHLKALAAQHMGSVPQKAVITVPAYFDEAARQATKDAAVLAGLDVLRLVNEPTAAALAYGLDSGAEGIYAMYDLGGGTFDVSLLKLEKGVFQVLSTGGNTALGGDDFDRLLQAHIAPEASISQQKARVIKEYLSSHPLYEDQKIQIEDATFRRIATPLIDTTLATFAHVVNDAAISVQDIQNTVLVGGSTRMPAVQGAIAHFTGKAALHEVDPDRVVAQGAAMQAHALTYGSDTLLLDVTPLSLGLETMGGLVEVLIDRNTPIPAVVEQEFTTYQENQTGMEIHVVQGEREMVSDCRSLAQFTLAGIPPMPAGAAKVAVRFALDSDGLLTVSAEEKTSAVRQEVAIKPSYGLAPEAVVQMLEESMVHARDDILTRLLEEARVEARRMMDATQTALTREGHLIEEAYRVRIRRQLEKMELLLAETNRDAIDASIHALEAMLGPFVEVRVNHAVASMLQGHHVDELDKQ